MKTLTEAPDDFNLVARLTNGEIELGVMPVIYGMRVRAGYVGAAGVELDWCCGDRQLWLDWAYGCARSILENQGSFENVPRTSRVKPIWNDMGFLMEVARLSGHRTVNFSLPPIAELRSRWREASTLFEEFEE